MRRDVRVGSEEFRGGVSRLLSRDRDRARVSSWLCLTDGSTAAARAAACALLDPSRAFIVPGDGSILQILRFPARGSGLGQGRASRSRGFARPPPRTGAHRSPTLGKRTHSSTRSPRSAPSSAPARDWGRAFSTFFGAGARRVSANSPAVTSRVLDPPRLTHQRARTRRDGRGRDASAARRHRHRRARAARRRRRPDTLRGPRVVLGPRIQETVASFMARDARRGLARRAAPRRRRGWPRGARRQPALHLPGRGGQGRGAREAARGPRRRRCARVPRARGLERPRRHHPRAPGHRADAASGTDPAAAGARRGPSARAPRGAQARARRRARSRGRRRPSRGRWSGGRERRSRRRRRRRRRALVRLGRRSVRAVVRGPQGPRPARVEDEHRGGDRGRRGEGGEGGGVRRGVG